MLNMQQIVHQSYPSSFVMIKSDDHQRQFILNGILRNMVIFSQWHDLSHT
jgi:hypothetical protein